MTSKRILATAHALTPLVHIGKNGITPTIIAAIKEHLKKRNLIKVKFLKSSMQQATRKELTNELATKTGTRVIQQIGFVAVLYQE